MDGVCIGEDVVGSFPIGVLVGGAKARDSECRRISKCSTEVGGRGPDPRRSCERIDRKSTRLNSSHMSISYAVFCLKKKNKGYIRLFNSNNSTNSCVQIT